MQAPTKRTVALTSKENARLNASVPVSAITARPKALGIPRTESQNAGVRAAHRAVAAASAQATKKK
jgi:hypothetical protein